MIIKTGGLSPEEWYKTPQGRAAAARPPLAPPPRRLPEPLATSAPARPAAPNPNSKESVYRTLHQELLRMYPDRSPADLSQMARGLADEFIAERNQSLDDMAKGPPGPTTLEGSGLPANYQGEWRWDGNKVVPAGQEYKDGQLRTAGVEGGANKRGDSRSRDGYGERRSQAVFGMAQATPPQSTGTPYGAADNQATRGERNFVTSLKNSREMGLQAERDKYRRTGVKGPLMAESSKDRIARQSQVAQFQSYAQGQSSLPPPGLAPRHAAGRVASPGQSEMYWQLVDGGMDPVEASSRVDRAFRYAPR